MERAEREQNVTAALEMAADEIIGLVETLRAQGAEAYRRGDQRTFEQINQRSKAVEDFHKQFASLQAEWQALIRHRRRHRRPNTALRPRAKRGELLPEQAYLFPILKALDEGGGSAKVADVLEAVKRMIGKELQPRDWERLGSGEIRWRNRTKWVRKYMVSAGLLRSDSPKGIYLADNSCRTRGIAARRPRGNLA